MQHVEIDSSLNKLLKKCAYIGILNKLQEENKLTDQKEIRFYKSKDCCGL